jgi:ubiquinone/menaquinone biosynthesis C-methylase UbiE
MGTYEVTKESKVLALIPLHKRALNLGCGPGIFTGALHEPISADVCQQYLNTVPNGVQCDAENLPFTNSSFDFVLFTDVIEHVRDDGKALSEICRILRNNGRMLLTKQNSRSLNYLVEGFYQKVIRRRSWKGWDASHLRFYTPKTLAKMLSASGFVIESMDSTYFVPYRLLKRRGKLLEKLNFQLEKLKGSTGWSLIVLCKKF